MWPFGGFLVFLHGVRACKVCDVLLGVSWSVVSCVGGVGRVVKWI